MGLLPLSYLLAVLAVLGSSATTTYDPTWESLDSRPLPEWYDEAKVGIFIHWGVFSVPSFGSEWFWSYWNAKSKDYVDFMTKNYKPDFGYTDFGPMFTAEFYDPYKWADILKKSGAQYVVFTSKHHEGFTMWPSKVSWNWNSKDVGPKQDLLGKLAKAIRNKTNMHFGVYHSMFEWFHPLYLLDKSNNYKTQYFVDTKTMPELLELVNEYKPEIIWSDGDWEAPDTYWKSTQFLAWLYNESPVKDTVVVNDRWGKDTPCKHGGYFTCQDKFNPKTLQPHKWENAMTMDKNSWGYRRNVDISEFLTVGELLITLAETVSCGGNLLINIGPTHDGRIIPIFQERLSQFGDWLYQNSESIFSTKPWVYQNDTLTPEIWYTANKQKDLFYALVTPWPNDSKLKLGAVVLPDKAVVRMIGWTQTLDFKTTPDKNVEITLPDITPDQQPNCNWMWVLSFQGAKPKPK